MAYDAAGFTPISGQTNPGGYGGAFPVTRPDFIIDDPLSPYRQSIKSLIKPNRFGTQMVFDAIVLHVGLTNGEQTLFYKMFSYLGSTPTQIPRFICMVPDLHDHLPNPANYASIQKQLQTALMYPVFELADQSLENIGRFEGIKEGSVVQVRFYDATRTIGQVIGLRAATKDSSTFGRDGSSDEYNNGSDLASRSDPSLAVGGPCPDLYSPQGIYLQETAASLGIDPNILLAISRVEAGPQGAEAVRFEPHLFLKGPNKNADIPYTRGDSDCPERRREGGCVPYVSYQANETDRAAFDRAYAIDPQAAVRSASFGLFQVVPFGQLSYLSEDPEEFKRKFDSDPLGLSYELLEARLSTPKNGINMVDAANNRDWTAFATAYNGRDQAKQSYVAKLEATFNSTLEQGCFDQGPPAPGTTPPPEPVPTQEPTGPGSSQDLPPTS